MQREFEEKDKKERVINKNGEVVKLYLSEGLDKSFRTSLKKQ